MARAHREGEPTDFLAPDAWDVTDDADDGVGTDAAEMAASREDAPEARTVTSRCRIRDRLHDEIEAFLASGGSIQHVETAGIGHLQRRPTSSLGTSLI